MIRLANWYFLLLIPLIIYIFLFNKKKVAIKYSSTKRLQHLGLKKMVKHKIGKIVIMTSLILLSIALARPQLTQEIAPIKESGIDIAILLDVSGSMESVDIKPNRLEVSRSTIDDFIKERPSDQLALIVFSGTAYTRIPLTLDHDILTQSLQEITTDSVNEDGTAIGMAISVGLNRLKKSDSVSKIMILVTDGDNNAGAINPNTASELAKEMGIKIYTIGVGTDETIIPVQIMGQSTYQRYDGGLNEALLQEIAETTGGQYYRAKDSKALSQIFENINQLETSDFDQNNFKQYKELAFILIKIALVLFLIGLFLDRYYFVQIP